MPTLIPASGRERCVMVVHRKTSLFRLHKILSLFSLSQKVSFDYPFLTQNSHNWPFWAKSWQLMHEGELSVFPSRMLLIHTHCRRRRKIYFRLQGDCRSAGCFYRL